MATVAPQVEGKRQKMATSSVQDPETFWMRLRKLVTRLVVERAHVEIVLVLQDGKLVRVRINRNFQPGDLPDL
jgi:hypothetical protein